MKKVKRCLWELFIALLTVIYAQVGLIITYALANDVEQTTTTYVVRRMINWGEIGGLSSYEHINLFSVLGWPFVVALSLFLNTAYTIGIVIGPSVAWLLGGGFLQWLGIIKG